MFGASREALQMYLVGPGLREGNKMSEKATMLLRPRTQRAIVDLVSAVVFISVLATASTWVYMGVRHVDLPAFVLILVAVGVALIVTYPLVDFLNQLRQWLVERCSD